MRPGSALATAMNSASVEAPSDGDAKSAVGSAPIYETCVKSLSASYGRFLNCVGAIEKGARLEQISVYPSGAACFTIVADTAPPAPGRLSMMNGLPNLGVRYWATSRATMSLDPPVTYEQTI